MTSEPEHDLDLSWSPREGEITIPYDPEERASYESGQPSEYDPWRWPDHLWVGRNSGGCFPEVVARAHFERRGYSVLLSEPRYPEGRGFILFHYRGMRRDGHAAFRRMQNHFPSVDLDEVAELAYQATIAAGQSGGGGDPDLFVFHPDSTERFFVEVKDDDELHTNQLLCFPIIEEHLDCPVKVVRLEPRPLAADSDAYR